MIEVIGASGLSEVDSDENDVLNVDKRNFPLAESNFYPYSVSCFYAKAFTLLWETFSEPIYT